MTQTPYNLLGEISQILYQDARTMSKMPQSEDKIIQEENRNKARLYLLAARILQDLLITGGENVAHIIEDGAAKGITLFKCDLSENLEKIMPPP